MKIKFDIREYLKLSPIKIINILLIVLIFLYLEYAYKNFISQLFGDNGYLYEFDILRYIETKILFIFSLLIIHSKRVSAFIYATLYFVIMFILIPNLILFEFMDTKRIIIYSIIALEICIILFSQKTYLFNTPILKPSQHIGLLFIITILMLIPFFTTYGFKLNFNILLLDEIYGVRAESAEKSNIFTAYFHGWLGKVIIPIMLVYGLIYKKKYLIIFSIISLLYLFLVAAHKFIFFLILIVLFFYFYRDYYRKIFLLLSVFLISFFVVRIVTVSFDNILFESILVRRAFFVPALLNVFYLDFFDNNHIYLSHSIFKYFFEYPYELNPAQVIGLEYFNQPKINANNGIISDGFMNFGLIGIIINIVLLSLIINIINSLRINPRFFGIFFIMLVTFNSSAFFTSLLTHGVIILLLLSLFLLKDTQSNVS